MRLKICGNLTTTSLNVNLMVLIKKIKVYDCTYQVNLLITTWFLNTELDRELIKVEVI